MREAVWGYAIIALGIIAVGVIWFFANVTRTDQNNYNLLKETVEAAMYDSIDLTEYRKTKEISINEQKFVENFIRRFSENADLSNSYKIEIFDISENPPKVSLRVLSTQDTNVTGELFEFKISNNIDSILEAKYSNSCTRENPCYYLSEYISIFGYANNNAPKVITWDIYTKDFMVDEASLVGGITCTTSGDKTLQFVNSKCNVDINVVSSMYSGSSMSTEDFNNYTSNDWPHGFCELSANNTVSCINSSSVDGGIIAALKAGYANAQIDTNSTTVTFISADKLTVSAKILSRTDNPYIRGTSKLNFVPVRYAVVFKYYYK